MKAISLTQPWASLVAGGAKKIETRGWNTSYRGPVALHAAKSFPESARRLCFDEPFLTALLDMGIGSPSDLPLGKVLGTAHIVRTYRFLSAADRPDEPELSFGDYRFGRWGIVMEDPVRFTVPIPARGSLSLWEWTAANGCPATLDLTPAAS